MTALRFHTSKAHGSWSPPVGSGAFAYKHGRVLPMQSPGFFAQLLERFSR